MAKYKVELTGVNTSELKVLTNEEQMKLFEELRAGNVRRYDSPARRGRSGAHP